MIEDFKMKNKIVVILLCLVPIVVANGQSRESRKLFGGYRITPKFCKPIRQEDILVPATNICMFNHECTARSGKVVGSCMDGFLFGACCQLASGSAGELLESDHNQTPIPSNNLDLQIHDVTKPSNIITSQAQNTGTKINSLLSTVQENDVIQVNDRPEFGSSHIITHHTSPDTYLVNNTGNEISSNDFQLPTTIKVAQTTDRASTSRVEDSTTIYLINSSPMITFQRPMFRPRPTTPKPFQDDNYILVPTITKPKPNKTAEMNTIVNIIQLMNESSSNRPNYGITSKKPENKITRPTTIYTRRPTITEKTTRQPPSTSYVFSTTLPPRRPTTPRPSTRPSQSSSHTRPYTTRRPPTTSQIQTTFPTRIKIPAPPKPAYFTTQRPSPPSTSYIYGTFPTKKPAVTSHISGPSFSVSKPEKDSITFPTPPIIVLSTETPQYGQTSSKPVAELTINNVVTATNNYHFSTTDRPSPTVLITPKPTNNLITGSNRPTYAATEYTTTAEFEMGTSANDFNNFPPVRNPNLNISASIASQELEDGFTTPLFIEDQALDTKMEKFVNKIISGLQGSFTDLRDVVYNKNKTQIVASSPTRKPTTKKPTTTKRPPTRISTPRPSSSKPGNQKPQRPTTSKPGSNKPTTRKPTTKKPTTKRPTVTTTTKRTKPTRKATTTEPVYEYNDEVSAEQLDYRSQCGVRPLMKSGRIVGGKGAAFGEWPWQVLVRESTWLGLFTKNKCGGVLISNRYVITAAHCQPGFLASLVAVFGEFDISGELESKRSISKNVKRVIVHRQYDAATFENDLALLELESPVSFDEHIVPICLPRTGEDFTGRLATVTGWGRLKYSGGVPSVLQVVQVPVMENHVCQEMFRTAGHAKVILESFLCAGYANGQKDSCEGDSGGPLVVQKHDGRWELAGTVSHGIKCAAPYLPGVYMRTAYFKPWLESITGVH